MKTTRRTRLIAVAAGVIVVIVVVAILVPRLFPAEGAYDLTAGEVEAVNSVIPYGVYVFGEGGGLRARALEGAFPDTEFYVSWPSGVVQGPALSSLIVAVREGKAYLMPRHFNCLLVDSGQSATGPEQEAVLQSLVILISPVEVARLPMRFEGYGAIEREREDYAFPFEAELHSWSEAGGVRIKWEFSLQGDGELAFETVGDVLAIGEGGYVEASEELSYEVGQTISVITWSPHALDLLPGGGCP
ncbi:MAG: hypothetical protein E3J64_07975 [Anaerolineales bacterium]|nr:MAG: hypothetical protein E3J64_07975 [Anaerolineales bacterium]